MHTLGRNSGSSHRCTRSLGRRGVSSSSEFLKIECGTLIETMTDYPKGHEHYFLQKRLDLPCGEAAPADLGGYKITLAGEEIAEELSGKLNRHDEACVPREHAYISICKKAIDENGKLIAGILGGVDGWDNPEIDALWVDESCRRQGIGSALL